jgi:hypothetical protein
MAFKRSGVRLPLAPPYNDLILLTFSVKAHSGQRTITAEGTTEEPRREISSEITRAVSVNGRKTRPHPTTSQNMQLSGFATFYAARHAFFTGCSRRPP